MSTKTYTNALAPSRVQEKTREDQVPNKNDAMVFKIDDLSFVKRFLIIGSEGGSYHSKDEKSLTKESARKIIDIVERNGKEVVDLAVKVSDEGFAPKNDPALFVLAICSASKDAETRKYALNNLSKIVRIPTHLFNFLMFVKQFRGWGSGLKKAVQRWLSERDAKNLAFFFTKYKSRDGFSAADVLRLAKPKAVEGSDHQLVYNYVVTRAGVSKVAPMELNKENEVANYLHTVDSVASLSEKEVIKAIEEFNLPMEVIPTNMRTKEVYRAVMWSSGLTWLLRNLGNLSKHEVISESKDGKEVLKFICDRIEDDRLLSKGRIHPMSILSAWKTYGSGRGQLGDGVWNVNSKIIGSLQSAFYKSFKYVQPTGKSFYIGIDCSASMTWRSLQNMQSREIAACIALTLVKTEPDCIVKGFSYELDYDDGTDMIALNINKNSSIDDVVSEISAANAGATILSSPIEDALKNDIYVDTFVIITDNEVNKGNHVYEVFDQYKRKINRKAKLIVLATELNDFTVADPQDPQQLDICGFSSDVPAVISEFSKI